MAISQQNRSTAVSILKIGISHELIILNVPLRTVFTEIVTFYMKHIFNHTLNTVSKHGNFDLLEKI